MLVLAQDFQQSRDFGKSPLGNSQSQTKVGFSQLSPIYKKIELVANIAIILVALVICAVVVQKYFLSGNRVGEPPVIKVGTKVALPGVDWAQNHKTLLMVLQKGCHFCTESAPFYQRLVQETANKGVKLVAVLPHPEAEARDYLQTLSVPIADVRQAPLGSINVAGTPTLILVDDKGQVAAAWVGKLPGEAESEVLKRL